MSLSVRTQTILDEALADKVAGAEIGQLMAGTDALNLTALATTGLIARTGTGASAVRTVTGTANQITVANGNGVSGNPTLALATTPTVTTGYAVGGVQVVGAKGAAVIDATDAASVITQLNALLARCRAHGLIA